MVRKILAGFLVFVLATIMLPILFMFSILRTYVSDEFVKDRVIPESYDVALLGAQYVATKAIPDTPEYVPYKENVAQTISSLLSKDEYVALMQSLFTSLYEQLSAYKGRETVISLLEGKKALTRFVVNALEKIPTCQSTEEMQRMLTAEKGIPNCLPPASSGVDIKKEIADQIELKIPSNLLISDARPMQIFESIANFIQYKKQFELMLIFVPIVFMALIGLLIFRPADSLFHWYGVIFTLGAVMASWLGFMYTSAVDFIQKFKDIPEPQESVLRFFISFPESWTWRVSIACIIIAVAFFILKRKYTKNTEHGERELPARVPTKGDATAKIVIRNGIVKRGSLRP